MWKVLFLALVVSLPVAAQEKVWYCEMTGIGETTPASGAQTYKPQKVKMKVTKDKVVFGSGGYFNNTVMTITWSAGDSFKANTDISSAVFNGGIFNSASVTFDYAVAITARCDDF